MTTSATPDKPIILINVFVVNPEDQWRLVDLLTRATEESVRHAPGFILSKLHRSLDGKKVAMYAHWRSMEAFKPCERARLPVATWSKRSQSQNLTLASTKLLGHSHRHAK